MNTKIPMSVPKMDINTKINTKINKLNKFSNLEESNSKPPVKLYKAVSALTLLTAAVFQGIGIALKEAIDKKIIKPKDAEKMVKNMMVNNSINNQKGGNGDILEQTINKRPVYVNDGAKIVLEIMKSLKNITSKSIALASKKTYDAGSKIISKNLEKIVPLELLDKSYSEVNPEFTQKIITLTNNLEAVSKDPRTRLAISNLSKAFADVGVDAINASLPNIERLTDKAWNVANQVGSKSIETGVNVALASLMTAVANVPGVGGMVVGGLQAGKTFNNIVETSIKAINGMSEVANEGIDTAIVAANTYEKSKARLEQPIREAKEAYDITKNNLANLSNMGNTVMKGGRRKTKRLYKKNKTRRLKIQKRINKSLKAFFK